MRSRTTILLVVLALAITLTLPLSGAPALAQTGIGAVNANSKMVHPNG